MNSQKQVKDELKCEFEYTLLSAEFRSKALMESQGFSKELTERAWLQLARSCALHTHCCPNFWGGRVDRMWMFQGIP